MLKIVKVCKNGWYWEMNLEDGKLGAVLYKK